MIMEKTTMKANSTPFSSDYRYELSPTFESTVTNGIARKFEEYRHYPSQEMMAALRHIPATVRTMLDNPDERKMYVCDLDVGVGKTTAVAQMLTILRDNGDLLTTNPAKDIGVVICLQRREQIERFIREAGLEDEIGLRGSFCVLVEAGARDSEGRPFSTLGAGVNNISDAQFLLTTQAMIQFQMRNQRSWNGAENLFYRGRPRPLRIWDEAFAMRREMSIDDEQIAIALGTNPRAIPKELRDWGVEVQYLLKHARAGELVRLPTPATAFEASRIFENFSVKDMEVAANAVNDLVSLSVTSHALVNRSDSERPIFLQYETSLPRDILPIMILDAGAKHKEVYHQQSETVSWLPTVTKRYDNVNITIRTGKSGARYFWHNADEILSQAVKDIQARPGREVLILHPKPNWYKHKNIIPKYLERNLSPQNLKRVHTLHWGAHDSVNDYRNCSLVLPLTLFHKPQAVYEAMAYAASATPMSDKVDAHTVRAVKDSDLASQTRQGLGRSCLRVLDGDQAQACEIIFTAPQGSALKTLLRTIFPGIQIKNDGPMSQQERVLEYIAGQFKQGAERVNCPDIYKSLSIDPGDFTRLMRTPAILSAFAVEGLEIVRSRPNYIRRLSQVKLAA